ncbi:MAG: hypothetical protein CMJ78_04210 [Planctomycetaceae bacterium]|nr:hypothetical protein [Planctomycetaceae bacterium]
MSKLIPTIDDELAELLEAVANRDLTPDQHKRLAERLEVNAEARAAFIQATAFDAMLSHEFPASEPHVATSALEIPETELKPSSKTSDRRRRTRLGYVMLVAALATVASLAIVFLRPSEPSAPIAKIAYQSNARWANQQRSQGGAIGTGVLQLDVGIARLDFANGATVTLQSPARFEILSTDRTRLSNGILTAHIPESAIGFKVLTPSLDVVDLGTAFGVTVGADGETDVCVFEGEVEVSLAGDSQADSTQRVREGSAVRTRSEADEIEAVAYKTNRYEEAWPVTSGVLQATGLMKFVSPGPDFVPGRYEDSESIVVFPERSQVVLPKDVKVDVAKPGQYQKVRRREQPVLPAGQQVRSYLLQLNPVGSFTTAEADKSRVIGQVTFDQRILGLIVKTTKLIASDDLLGHPHGDYGNSLRGIEPMRPDDPPNLQRDLVILSENRRTLSLDLSAGSAVDQIRVVVSEETNVAE